MLSKRTSAIAIESAVSRVGIKGKKIEVRSENVEYFWNSGKREREGKSEWRIKPVISGMKGVLRSSITLTRYKSNLAIGREMADFWNSRKRSKIRWSNNETAFLLLILQFSTIFWNSSIKTAILSFFWNSRISFSTSSTRDNKISCLSTW